MVGRLRYVAQKGGRMCRLKETLGTSFRKGIRAASLLEAVVAAVVFLIVFTIAMELLPRLTLREDETLLVADAEYRVARAFDKYATGVWPVGVYSESYDWGTVEIKLTPYRNYDDLQMLIVLTHIDGSRKRIARRQIIPWLQ